MLKIILTILVILILDGLVSATEAAFFSASVTRLKILAEKDWRARVFLKLKEKSTRPIVTLISLSNLITIAGSVWVGALTTDIYGSRGLGVVSAILTFLIMVFAEIIPKKLGERFSETVALTAAPFLKIISLAFSPLVWFVERIVHPFTHPGHLLITPEEEISLLAKIGGKEGLIEEGESQLIQRIFKLNDITAEDLMTPRTLVQFIDGNQTLSDVKEEILHARHSRLPVFEGTPDQILGVAHLKELLSALGKGEEGGLVREYARPVSLIPGSMFADDLLKSLQQGKMHLAIVIDEHGGVAGVVGLEDILEELVGEIIDEKEVAPETIKRVAKNEIVVHGQTKIETLNHFFNTELKSKKTVNGFLLGKFGRFPRQGEETVLEGLRFVIEGVSERAIEKVRVFRV